jgi:hypothetical protein
MIIHYSGPKRKAKQKTKREREQYQKWLASHGSTGKKQRKTFVPMKPKKFDIVRAGANHSDIPSVELESTEVLTKNGIMKDFHKLTENDRKIINDVASCTAPLHKGHYTYVSPGTDPASLGRKNEVL